jgi:hypothetical protein
MTEQEWEQSDFIRGMVEFLLDKQSRRKFQLFAVACCRALWDRFPPGPARETVNVAERFADGMATDEELRASKSVCDPLTMDSDRWISLPAQAADSVACCGFETPGHASRVAKCTWYLATCGMKVGSLEFRITLDQHRELQVELLHEIAGNPFRAVRAEREWLTSTVLVLARQMYDAREFSAMPILADALQDAGCDNAAVLAHCRDTSAPHVRGCWVVDLILGKE